MTSLNKELLKRFKCPVCLNFMAEKIFMCTEGHGVCGKCLPKLKVCAICRMNMTNSRNYDLEAVAECLYYPCAFTGCKEYIKPGEHESHANSCWPYPCLLKGANRICHWSGPRSEIETHVTTYHKVEFWTTDDDLDDWQTDLNDPDEIGIIKTHGQLFYIYRTYVDVDEFNPVKSIMYLAVQYIGPADKACSYTYELKVCCKDSPREIIFIEKCHDDAKTMKEMIESGYCVAIPMNILNTFKINDNTRSFKLKIQKVEEM